jgi:hypothetical protein
VKHQCANGRGGVDEFGDAVEANTLAIQLDQVLDGPTSRSNCHTASTSPVRSISCALSKPERCTFRRRAMSSMILRHPARIWSLRCESFDDVLGEAHVLGVARHLENRDRVSNSGERIPQLVREHGKEFVLPAVSLFECVLGGPKVRAPSVSNANTERTYRRFQ